MSTTPSTIDPDEALGDLVNHLPGAARVLERYELDYCCGGRRSLAAACSQRHVSLDAVIAELEHLGVQAVPDWVGMGPSELVDHLESTHHRYLREELPRLDALAEKVAGVHGARHPELLEVLADVKDLRDDLEPHLLKEERVLFPMIRELAAATGPVSFHCGSLRNPISVMLVEHDRAGALLAQLRDRTDDHTAPPDACASFRALYRGLAELEADTHLHVHKENNLLFPAVVELETAHPHG
jgi:regulator of cell morphogenesis and NO signaling